MFQKHGPRVPLKDLATTDSIVLLTNASIFVLTQPMMKATDACTTLIFLAISLLVLLYGAVNGI